MQQLALLSGTTPRSIRAYIESQIVPRSPFRGSGTRYDRRQLLFVLAVRRLRAHERLPLTEIRKRLQSLPPAELEALAVRDLSPGPTADALGLPPPAPPVPVHTAAPGLLASLPQWTRLELALGLELHVRTDASTETLELVKRIHAAWASGAVRT